MKRGEIMRCDDVQQCLLDEALPRPEGLDAHVLGCDQCQPFSKSLSLARTLRGEQPIATRRVPVAKARRRLQIIAAFGLIATGLVVEARLARDSYVRNQRAPEVALSPENHSIPINDEREVDEAAGWQALARLEREAFEAKDPRVDPTFDRFGALASWVAPTRTYPIRSLHLGKADTRIIHTSED